MPAAKTSDAKSTFDPFAVFQKVTDGFDVETARAKILDGVKQTQQLTIDSVKGFVDTVAKVAPSAPSLPFAAEFQRSTLATIDFASKVFAAQTEFAANLVKTFAPAS